eukprot:gene37794-biopygen25031
MADDLSLNPSRDDFAALLDASMGGAGGDFAEGTVINGIVVGIEKDFAIIDVGLKTEGRILIKEFGPGRPARPRKLGRQGPGQLLAVEGLDHIEQGHGLTHLVGLQGPDQAQLNVGTATGPASDRLLDAVFAENPLPGGQHGVYPVIRLLLGDRHQSHIPGRPAGLARSGGDAVQHGKARGGDIR